MEVTEEFESSRTAYEAVGQPMGATDEWWRGQDFHLHFDRMKIIQLAAAPLSGASGWGWILRVLGLDDLSENESNRMPFRLAGSGGVEPPPADLESAVLPQHLHPGSTGRSMKEAGVSPTTPITV